MKTHQPIQSNDQKTKRKYPRKAIGGKGLRMLKAESEDQEEQRTMKKRKRISGGKNMDKLVELRIMDDDEEKANGEVQSGKEGVMVPASPLLGK